MLQIILVVLPVFALILIGHLCRRHAFPGEGFWAPAEALTYYLLLPCLLVTTLAEADFARLAAWPMLAHPEADPVFALFFEANGLSAAGREPYRSLVPGLIAVWIDWTADFLDGTAAERRAEAEAAIALLDGLLLLRQLAGPESAERAAERLGVA